MPEDRHEDRIVTFRLPPDMLARLAQVARQRNCAPADLIRTALAALLAPDRQPALPTQAVISAIAQTALSWHDLLRGLRQNGAVLRQDTAGALWLHSWPADRPLGPAALWDIERHELVLRFGAPFPGASRATGLPLATDQGTGPGSAAPRLVPPRPPTPRPGVATTAPAPKPMPTLPEILRPIARNVA
jgi:predicted transcriptional regulator